MFDNIIGHDNVKNLFSNFNDLRSTYIFSGQDGIGKRTMALEIAKNLVGVDRNLHVIKSDKGNISIDDIRKMQEEIVALPLGGLKFKRVIIIEDAECLNEVSSNAILKSLEEPYSHCMFILITKDVNLMLKTIISRSMIIRFKLLDNNLIMDKLITMEEDSAFTNFISIIIHGRYGRLESVLNGSNLNYYSNLYKLCSNLTTVSDINAINSIVNLFSKDVNILYNQLDDLCHYLHVIGNGKILSIVRHYTNLLKLGATSGAIDMLVYNSIKSNKKEKRNK